MRFEACYYVHGNLHCVSTSDWQSLPERGLLWVTVFVGGLRHTLIYADWYWATGDSYGMIYDGTHCPEGCASWRVTDGAVRRTDESPPAAHMIAGLMIPDDEWSRMRNEP